MLIDEHSNGLRLIVASMLLLTLLAVQRPSSAVDRIDGSAVDQKSGLRLRFSSSGIQKSGYRVVELTITRRLMINVDRRIAVNIKPQNWHRNTVHSPQMRVVVDMPEGVTSVTERVLIPQTDVWSYLQFSVFEDGDQIRDLSILAGTNRQTDQRITETFPGWWFIDSDFESVQQANQSANQTTRLLPNVRALLELMPHYQQEFDLLAIRDLKTVDWETLSDLQKLTTVNMTGFTALPENWLEYTCYDIAVISMSDLRQLQQLPDKWTALRTFVRQGATLIVYGTSIEPSDSDFTNLDELSQVLDGKPRVSPFSWETPLKEDYQLPLENFLPNVLYHTNNGQYRARGVGRPQQSQYYNYSEDFSGEAIAPPVAPATADVPPAGFRIREFGLGRVVAIPSHKPFRVLKDGRGHQQWAWILKSLGTERVMWYQRHGLSNGRRNADFWNFLLEGVGAAPVLPFLFLITGFVFVIGPVNYLTLRKWNRLYLILFTVPVCAAVVTIGLLAYAFFADGISTRMRLRSFTLIDSDEGDALTWSRQSYYAGLPPSGGISFPDSAAVFPIVYAPDESSDVNQTLRWEDDKQILARGYLRTRTLAQMMIYDSTTTNQKIDINRETNNVTAANGFVFDVDFVIAVDPDLEVAYVTKSKLSAGESAVLAQISLAEAKDTTANLIADNRLAIPAGVDFGYGPSRRIWNQIDTDSSPVQASTSLLEESIDELRLYESDQFVYYAITTKCHDFVPTGADASSEEDGFHVIKGYWKP